MQAAPAGWYPDPENPTQQRYWDGAAWTPNVAPASPSEYAPQDLADPGSTPQPVVDAPALQTWKSSVGFSVLGLVVGFPLLVTFSTLLAIPLMILVDFLTGNDALFAPLGAMTGNILMIIYAAKFYPSYFTEKPLLKSNRAISFANLMFGNWVGFIWNGNLTKKTKGISNVVLIVFSALICASLALNIVGALLFGAISNSTSTPVDPSSDLVPPVTEKDVQPLERTEDANIYTDAETGASFVVPSIWTELPLSKEREILDTKFLAPDGANVMYGSVDYWSVLTEEERRSKAREDFDSMDDLEGDLSEILGYSGSDATAQSVILNGVEYFVLSLPVTANGVELRCVNVVRLENGHLYLFQYYSTPAELAGGSEDEDLQTFYSMVASMVYPED